MFKQAMNNQHDGFNPAVREPLLTKKLEAVFSGKPTFRMLNLYQSLRIY